MKVRDDHAKISLAGGSAAKIALDSSFRNYADSFSLVTNKELFYIIYNIEYYNILQLYSGIS